MSLKKLLEKTRARIYDQFDRFYELQEMYYDQYGIVYDPMCNYLVETTDNGIVLCTNILLKDDSNKIKFKTDGKMDSSSIKIFIEYGYNLLTVNDISNWIDTYLKHLPDPKNLIRLDIFWRLLHKYCDCRCGEVLFGLVNLAATIPSELYSKKFREFILKLKGSCEECNANNLIYKLNSFYPLSNDSSSNNVNGNKESNSQNSIKNNNQVHMGKTTPVLPPQLLPDVDSDDLIKDANNDSDSNSDNDGNDGSSGVKSGLYIGGSPFFEDTTSIIRNNYQDNKPPEIQNPPAKTQITNIASSKNTKRNNNNNSLHNNKISNTNSNNKNNSITGTENLFLDQKSHNDIFRKIPQRNGNSQSVNSIEEIPKSCLIFERLKTEKQKSDGPSVHIPSINVRELNRNNFILDPSLCEPKIKDGDLDLLVQPKKTKQANITVNNPQNNHQNIQYHIPLNSNVGSQSSQFPSSSTNQLSGTNQHIDQLVNSSQLNKNPTNRRRRIIEIKENEKLVGQAIGFPEISKYSTQNRIFINDEDDYSYRGGISLCVDNNIAHVTLKLDKVDCTEVPNVISEDSIEDRRELFEDLFLFEEVKKFINKYRLIPYYPVVPKFLRGKYIDSSSIIQDLNSRSSRKNRNKMGRMNVKRMSEKSRKCFHLEGEPIKNFKYDQPIE